MVLADREDASEGLERTWEIVGEQAPEAERSRAVFDITDTAAVKAAFLDRSAPADLLFNNAGLQGEFATTLDASLDSIRRVIEVNVVGAIAVLQAFGQALAPTGRPGAVVNSASMAGVSGAPNMLGYAASKAAMIGITKAAAKDLAPHGIRVNAVSPGFIGPGAMWTKQVAEQALLPSPYYGDDTGTVEAQMLAMVPLRRYGSLDEVAATVRFLLSDEASYLTGINIEVAGGGT